MEKEEKKEKKIYEEPKSINVATKLASSCIKNDMTLPLLIFYIIVLHYSKDLDGRMIHPTKNKIREMCKCSDTIACMLLKVCKENKFFFNYDAQKDVLTIRNTKKHYTKKYIHPKYGVTRRIDVLSINRYDGDKKKTFTYGSIKKELEKLLLEKSIKSCEKNYKYYFHEQSPSMHVAYKYKCGIHGSNLFFPSQRQMCSIIGANNTKYVSRLLKDMIEEGRIEEVAINQLHYIGNPRIDGEEEMNHRCKPFHTIVIDPRTHSVYAASPKIYRTIKRKGSGVRNIILNHQNRLTNYYKKSEAEKAKKEMAERRFAQKYDTCC